MRSRGNDLTRQLTSPVVGPDPEEPRAVFLFHEDGSGVDAYPSLAALHGDIEAVDVRNHEYAMFADDGRVVEAHTGGHLDQDVLLRITDEKQPAVLRERLSTCLPMAGVDSSLASSPLRAAQALVDARWADRRPRWPTWLDRRLNGPKPEIGR
jgi:hypothetical protein